MTEVTTTPPSEAREAAIDLARAARELVNARLPQDLDPERPFWVACRNVRDTLDTWAYVTGVDGEQTRKG